MNSLPSFDFKQEGATNKYFGVVSCLPRVRNIEIDP